jgi:hypothetical protein
MDLLPARAAGIFVPVAYFRMTNLPSGLIPSIRGDDDDESVSPSHGMRGARACTFEHRSTLDSNGEAPQRSPRQAADGSSL